MNRFKFKYRVALLMVGFSLFYAQAADKDALGKKTNTRINTAAGFTDEDVNEKQVETVLNKHSNGFPLNAAEIEILRTNINKLPVKAAGNRRYSISGRGRVSRDAIDLFFSEYAEGSSNNKYLEIYNGTGSDVDLSNYSLSSCSNGCDEDNEWDYPDNVTFAAGTIIADGDVYVVYHGSADAAIVAEGDQTFTYLSNGDDVFAITEAGATASSYTIIDIIGEMGDDPGDGWDVAGVTNGTKDHTLVRKSTVISGNTNWSASADTTADNSEWIVLDQNTWDYVGSHPHTELEAQDPALVITSPESGSTLYSTDVTVSFTVSNFTVATSGGDGHVHYTVDGGITVMQYTTDDIALTGLSESSHTVIVWLADNSHANLSPHVADTVAFTVSTQTVTSIYDIQFVSDPTTDDASPLDGQTVIISGVVTAEFWGSSSNRYLYVQDAEGPWNGVVCFEYNGWDTFNFVSSTGITNSVAEGDSVLLPEQWMNIIT